MKLSQLILIPLFGVVACQETEKSAEQLQEEITNAPDTLAFENVIEPLAEIDPSDLPQRMKDKPEMVLSEANGDLDKDGIPEKVVVYSRDLEWESSEPRDLVIYKQKNGIWEVWIETENAILHADEGGMMGDPFDAVKIVNGILEIHHWGGSSWKWAHTDKFRYQEQDFYLIGYTSNYGKPCEYWEEFDYNLSTGDCEFTFDPDACEVGQSEAHGPKRQEKFNHKMKETPKLNNRRTFEYTFKSPKGEDIYL